MTKPLFDRIGDPTILGWSITLGYAAAAFLSCRTALFLRPNRPWRVWLAFASFALLMGLNKQLDLQVVLTDIGRTMAKSQGWYQERGIVQLGFVVTLGSALTAFFAWLFWQARGHWRSTISGFLGVASLVLFVLLRALSFDVHDLLIRHDGTNITWLLEVLGIVCLAWASFRAQHGLLTSGEKRRVAGPR